MPDGQHGCFMQLSAVQWTHQDCVAQRYEPTVQAAATCLGVAGGCQCSSPANCAASCPSLVGCVWGRLMGSQLELATVFDTMSTQVLPQLTSLNSSSLITTGGASSVGGYGTRRRRRLAQLLPTAVVDGAAAAVDAFGAQVDRVADSVSAIDAAVGNTAVAAGAADDSVVVDIHTGFGGGSHGFGGENDGGAPGMGQALRRVLAPEPESDTAGAYTTDFVISPGTTGVGNATSPAPSPAATPSPANISSPAAGSGQAASSPVVSSPIGATPASSPSPSPSSSKTLPAAWSCIPATVLLTPGTQPTLVAYMAVLNTQAMLGFELSAVQCLAATSVTFMNHAAYQTAMSTFVDALSNFHSVIGTYRAAGSRDIANRYAAQYTQYMLNAISASNAQLQLQYSTNAPAKNAYVLMLISVSTDLQNFLTEALQLQLSYADNAADIFDIVINHITATLKYTLLWAYNSLYPPFATPLVLPTPAAQSQAARGLRSALTSLAGATFPSLAASVNNTLWVNALDRFSPVVNEVVAAAANQATSPNTTVMLQTMVTALSKVHVTKLFSAGGQTPSDALSAQRGAAQFIGGEALALLGLMQLVDGVMRPGAMQVSQPWQQLLAAGLSNMVSASAVTQNPQLPSDGKDAELMAWTFQMAGNASLCAATGAGSAGCNATAAVIDHMLQYRWLNDIVDPGYLTLRDAVWREVHCNSRSAADCLGDGNCVLRATALVGNSSSPQCHAPDALVLPLTGSDSPDADVADWLPANSSCAAVVALPECEALTTAAGCSNVDGCQWSDAAARQALFDYAVLGSHIAANVSASGAGAATAAGMCTLDWASLLADMDASATQALLAAQQKCAGYADQSRCQGAVLELGDGQEAAAAKTRALRIGIAIGVVLAVLLPVLLGAYLVWRNRMCASPAADSMRRKGKKGKKGKKKLIAMADSEMFSDLHRQSRDSLQRGSIGAGRDVAVACTPADSFSSARSQGSLGSSLGMGSAAGDRDLNTSSLSVGPLDRRSVMSDQAVTPSTVRSYASSDVPGRAVGGRSRDAFAFTHVGCGTSGGGGGGAGYSGAGGGVGAGAPQTPVLREQGSYGNDDAALIPGDSRSHHLPQHQRSSSGLSSMMLPGRRGR